MIFASVGSLFKEASPVLKDKSSKNNKRIRDDESSKMNGAKKSATMCAVFSEPICCCSLNDATVFVE